MLSDYLGTQEKKIYYQGVGLEWTKKIILAATSCSQYLAFLSWPKPKGMVLYIRFACLTGKKTSFMSVLIMDDVQLPGLQKRYAKHFLFSA